MTAVAAKKRRKKRKPKCSAAVSPSAGKRTFRYDRKLGCMVEVLSTFDAKKGSLVETVKPVDDEPKCKDWLRPRAQNNRAQGVAGWPLTSNSASIHPSQVAEMNAILKRKGVRTTEHDRFGRPIFRDQRHRSEYLRARGFCDLDAGYRDPEPLRFDGKVHK